MKTLTSTIVFLFTFSLGLAVSNGTTHHAIHEDCPLVWGQETREKPLFSLEEATGLLNERVRGKAESPYPKTIGKVIHLESVKQDQFLVMVTWGNSSEKKKSDTRVFDKVTFENLEVLK